MAVLIVNCGSTSIKASVMDAEAARSVRAVHVDRLGTGKPSRIRWDDGAEEIGAAAHRDVLAELLPQLVARSPATIEAVGHRVVHGGTRFRDAQIVTEEVATHIEAIASLAPLHNPRNLAGIRAAQAALPDVPHVAVFDTAFHHTLPPRARHYALAPEAHVELGIRRYGFHGTSHQFVAERAAAFLGEPLQNLRLVTCHLGGGCSVCAVEYGRSIETSMGMTPLEGLVMSTRAGDVDPGAILHWMRATGGDAEAAEQWLNKESGLLGLSGRSGDMRDIEAGAEAGDPRCQLALQVFCHRLRKYIGAYAAVMGGVDGIVFTGGIGENSATIRHRVSQRLDFLGCRLDESKNRRVDLTPGAPVADLSQEHSRVRLLAVATDEMLAIARQVIEAIAEPRGAARRRIPVAISARHVHLTQAAVEALFGEGHELTPYKPLSQPGQFAAEELVTLVGPKRSLENVRVLGPVRSKNQVEISRTDEFYLGIDAPVRASGQVENTPGITLQGTEGRTLELRQGVICALRHIHMTPEDADAFEVQDGELVEVEVGQDGGRSLTFGDVLIRVKSTYRLEMHIDTDEGNAAELAPRDEGELEDTDGTANLVDRRTSR